jgi:hypothetical protein
MREWRSDVMAGDYVPHSELELIDWAGRVVGFLEEHPDEMGLLPGELAALRLEYDEFAAGHDAYTAARTAAKAACSAKDAARGPLVKHLRSVAARVQIYPHMAHEVKAKARAVIGKSPRHPKFNPSEDRPLATIQGGQPLRHVIRVMNLNSTGIHKARPCNVRDCEVWRRLGDYAGEWEYAGIAAGKPLVITYSGRDVGRQAHYRFRWVTRRGEKGAWSGVHSATVAG